MKCELMIWKNMIKNLKIKEILALPYYYIMRIIFINNLTVNKLKFPNSIGNI